MSAPQATTGTVPPVSAAALVGAPRRRRSRFRSRRAQNNVVAYLFIAPAILGVLLLVLYPLASSVYFSFTDWDGLSPAEWVGAENYRYLFTQDPTFWPSMRATAYFVLLTVPSVLIGGLALALLVNRALPGVKLFRTIYYLPVVLPSIAVLTLWTYIYDPLYGLANQILRWLHLPTSQWLYDEATAMPSIVLVGLWGVGGTMIIFLAGLQNVPAELYEASALDGAGRIRQFLSVTLPMMTPLLLLQLILATNFAFQAFNQVQVMTKGGPGTSTYLFMFKIYDNAFGVYPQLGLASAEAIILFLIVMIVTYFALRSSRSWVYEGGE